MTIRAASPGSAAGIQAALAAFQPRLVEGRGRYTVLVHLGTEAEILGVLTARQDYVCERADGGAQVDFEGRSYTLHPDPVQPSGL